MQEALKGLFVHLDRDSNGVLTAEDFAQQRSAGQAWAMVQGAFDLDGNGQVTL